VVPNGEPISLHPDIFFGLPFRCQTLSYSRLLGGEVKVALRGLAYDSTMSTRMRRSVSTHLEHVQELAPGAPMIGRGDNSEWPKAPTLLPLYL